MKTHRALMRRRQTGLSLVELMVGIAVGMFIVAAASLMVATQLSDNRRLLVETQIQQDLRAAADIIARDLRRSGSFRLDQAHVGLANATAAGTDNPLMGLPLSAAGVTASAVEYSYMRSLPETGPFEFQLSDGAIKSRVGAVFQDLTDPSTVTITDFDVTPVDEPPLPMVCQRLCADGTQDCWPQLRVRRFTITITGQAVSDPSVVRTVNVGVRLRNDDVNFRGASLCP